jgi:hypothetical protein
MSIYSILSISHKINLGKMAHNIPADKVLAARTRALHSIVPKVRDQGRQNVAEVLHGNERSD